MAEVVAPTLARILKLAPLWFLTAAFVSNLVIWSTARFITWFPAGTERWAPSLALVFGVFAASRFTAEFLERRRAMAPRERRKLLLYRPLYILFVKNAPSKFQSKGPDLRDRLEDAWTALRSFRKRRGAIRRAIRALLEQPPIRGAYEYGGGFPFGAIEKLVSKHQALADAELLQLIGAVHYSYAEEVRTDELTGAELALYDYIMRRHDDLSRRFE
jgi:hypothetical protein